MSEVLKGTRLSSLLGLLMISGGGTKNTSRHPFDTHRRDPRGCLGVLGASVSPEGKFPASFEQTARRGPEQGLQPHLRAPGSCLHPTPPCLGAFSVVGVATHYMGLLGRCVTPGARKGHNSCPRNHASLGPGQNLGERWFIIHTHFKDEETEARRRSGA